MMAYKGHYRLAEFWDEFSQGTLWKKFASEDGSPAEAANIAEIIHLKIDEKPFVLPIDTAKTHTGKAIVMVLLTLSGGRPPT